MQNTRWNDTSDHSARNAAYFDGRADCVVWLAARLDEGERMLVQDRYATASQSLDDTLQTPATGRSTPVAARRWIVAALIAASVLIVHFIAG